jgi:3-isopropylmalate/(R)-2-methylmalate dehydratase small subunit
VKAIEGRAWVFGDDVNTDVMAPGLYFKLPMAEMARHCLEAIDPAFPASVKPGDIVVAGRNFGVGSAREQAAMALTHLGVGAVLSQCPQFRVARARVPWGRDRHCRRPAAD